VRRRAAFGAFRLAYAHSLLMYTALFLRVGMGEQCKRKKLICCLTKRNENRRFLSFSFAASFFFLL